MVYDTAVMLWLQHSKNNWRYGRTKPIARFCTPEIGAHLLTVAHLGNALKASFLDKILSEPAPKEILTRYHIFSDWRCRPLLPACITSVIKSWTAANNLPVLNVRKMRHVVVGFSRRYMDAGLDDTVASGQQQGNMLLDLQAGHSTATATKVYARANDLMNGMNENSLRAACFLSMDLWDMLIPSRGPIRLPNEKGTLGFRSAFSQDGRLRAELEQLRARAATFDQRDMEILRLQDVERKDTELRLSLATFLINQG